MQVTTKNYSFGKNLSYMAKAFYKPNMVIDLFFKETSPLYAIVPLILFTTLFEITYILDYIFKAPAFFHFLGNILKVPDNQWNFYQIFLLPVVHIVDFFIYGGVIYTVSRLLRIRGIDIVKIILFFMFIWNTIGLLGFVTENLAFHWKMGFLFYVQPIYVVIPLLYLMEFIHKQAGISRWMSFSFSMSGLIIFLGFRMVFLG